MLFKDYAPNRPARIGISDERKDKRTIYVSGRQRERAKKQRRRRRRRRRRGHRRRVGGVEKSLGGELQRGGYLFGGGTKQ